MEEEEGRRAGRGWLGGALSIKSEAQRLGPADGRAWHTAWWASAPLTQWISVSLFLEHDSDDQLVPPARLVPILCDLLPLPYAWRLRRGCSQYPLPSSSSVLSTSLQDPRWPGYLSRCPGRTRLQHEPVAPGLPGGRLPGSLGPHCPHPRYRVRQCLPPSAHLPVPPPHLLSLISSRSLPNPISTEFSCS